MSEIDNLSAVPFTHTSLHGEVKFQSSRFIAAYEGKPWGDDVLYILKARCIDYSGYGLHESRVRIVVEAKRDFECEDEDDIRGCINGHRIDCAAELEEWLDSVEQEIDRCIELHEATAKALSETSTDTLIELLAGRGIDVSSATADADRARAKGS